MDQSQGGSDAKISVIVPAYKAANWIQTCVRSLQKQDHRKIEIVVVDDCSPDQTGVLVEELAAKDPRVKLVSPSQNVGVHGARALGVSASSGDFIGFVDADDYVEPTMYSTLYQRLADTGASIAICSASIISEGRRLPVLRVGIRSSGLVDRDVLPMFCRMKFGSGVLWNKLYERRVIEGPALLKLERAVDASEDYIVNFGAFTRAQAVALCSAPLYNYVVHSSNASGERGWPAFARLFRAYVVCLEKYAADSPRLPPLIDQLYLKQLHYPVYQMTDGDEPSSEVLEHIAASLRRLADINPTSIYSILHSMSARYSRLDRVLKTLRRGK